MTLVIVLIAATPSQPAFKAVRAGYAYQRATKHKVIKSGSEEDTHLAHRSLAVHLFRSKHEAPKCDVEEQLLKHQNVMLKNNC